MVDPTEDEQDPEQIPSGDDDDGDDDSDGCRAIGDVTIPCPVTITDCTNAFIRDMKKGFTPVPIRKPTAVCPECGRPMHLCSKCESGKVCTGEP